MDSTLLAVIIGGLLTLFGNAVTQWLASRKEETHWLRQQEAEENKLKRDEQKAEKERGQADKERTHEIYLNSIQYLSALVAVEKDAEEKFKLSGEKKLQLLEEVHKWLALLALRHTNDAHFLSMLEDFTEQPDKYAAMMRNDVIELANNDNNISPHKKAEKPTKELGSVSIQFQIDEEFRRQQLIDGTDLPQLFAFSYNISKLTTSQRKKLIDIYFNSHKRIPDQFTLKLPVFNSHSNGIIFGGDEWKAQLNPMATQPQEILEVWEADYESSMERTQEEVRKTQSNP
jgi:hypothetical protein